MDIKTFALALGILLSTTACESLFEYSAIAATENTVKYQKAKSNYCTAETEAERDAALAVVHSYNGSIDESNCETVEDE